MARLILLALLLVPSVAMADPISVTVFFAQLGLPSLGVFIANLTIAQIAGAALLVNGLVSASRQRAAARRAWEASLQDRKVVLRSAESPRTITYGRDRVGGTLVYACTSGTYNEYLHLVIAIAGHEIDAVEEVYLGEDALGTLDGSGWATAGRYFKSRVLPYSELHTIASGAITLPRGPDSIDSITTADLVPQPVPYTWTSGTSVTFDSAYNGTVVNVTYRYTDSTAFVRCKKFLGTTAGERDTDLETDSAGQWTSAHLGKGVARLHLTLLYDPDVFPTGVPNVTAVIRGKKVYNTQTAVTEWNANAALCANDYLVSALGFGVSQSEVNSTLVNSAVSVCDETVTTTAGSQSRYQCNGTLSTEADRIENLGVILSAMVGTVARSGGEWLIRAGAYVTPTLDLDDDDLADGQIDIGPALPKRELFNAIRGKFVDPTQHYAVTDFPPYASAAYATDDGGTVLYKDISLPMTNDAEAAQRLAKLILHRSRQALVWSANFKLSAYKLQPGDTFRMTSSLMGWSLKVFRVIDRRLTQPGQVRLTMQEEASAVYDWTYTEAVGLDPAPNTNLPEPWFVAALTGLTVASGASYYRVLADGARQSFIRISWDQSQDVGVLRGGRIEVYVKRTAETNYQRISVQGDQTSVDFDAANGEMYNVAVRATNFVAFSNYAFATHTVSSAPTNTVSTGSITADRLASLPNHAMSITPDPGCEDWTAWVLHSGTAPTQTALASLPFGRYAWQSDVPSQFYSKPVPIDRSKAYRAICWMDYSLLGQTGNCYLLVAFFDGSGNRINGTTDGAGWPSVGDFHYFGLLEEVPAAGKEYSITFGAGQTPVIPADARYVAIGALLMYNSGTGSIYFNGRIQQLQETDLIAANAATEVQVATSTSGTSTLGSGGGFKAITAAGVTVTNDAGDTVDIIITASFTVSTPSSTTCTAYIADYDEGPSGHYLQVGEAVLLTANGSKTVLGKTTLAAGASKTLGVIWYAAVADSWSYTGMVVRVEMIKR